MATKGDRAVIAFRAKMTEFTPTEFWWKPWSKLSKRHQQEWRRWYAAIRAVVAQ